MGSAKQGRYRDERQGDSALCRESKPLERCWHQACDIGCVPRQGVQNEIQEQWLLGETNE